MEYSRNITGESVESETYQVKSSTSTGKSRDVNTLALLLIRRLAIVSTGWKISSSATPIFARDNGC